MTEEKIVRGKLIKNDMLKEGPGRDGKPDWKLYQLVLLMDDGKNKKINVFNENCQEFMDKYVAITCDYEPPTTDNIYPQYKFKSIKEMTENDIETAKKEESSQTKVNTSVNDYQNKKINDEVDWDGKEKRKHIENALTRATGMLQLAKDMDIINKDNTKDLVSLKQKWFIIADSVMKKIYGNDDSLDKSKEEVDTNNDPFEPNEDVIVDTVE